MLTFSANSTNIIGRVFFLLLTFILIYIFTNIGLKDHNMAHIIFKIPPLHFKFKVLYIMYFLIAVVIFLAVTIATSLLNINRVEVDMSTGNIRLFSPFKQKTIQINEVTNYFETIHKNAYKEWHGLLIKLKDDTTIQLTGQNINRIGDFKKYLTQKDIVCVGRTRMKFPFI
jgi:hypothetical protein